MHSLNILLAAAVLTWTASCAFAADEARPIQSNGAWERIEKPLIWNFGNMYQPCVREFPGEEYPYKMWFFGWASEDCNPGFSGCDAIYAARSKNLTDWEIYAGDKGWDTNMDPKVWVPVVSADDKFYDAWHNGDPSVVYKDGVYYMAFSSTSKPFDTPRKGHTNMMMLCVMGATSNDGIHWTKTEQPLLIESEAAQDPESAEGWIGDFHRPSLMWDQGKWRLWFDYWVDNDGLGMGYAENTGEFGAKGGFVIKSDLKKPLIHNWPNPEVIKIGGKYYSFADPSGYPGKRMVDNGWTSRQLCEAVSDDGLKWDIIGFIAPDADAPACHVPQAFTTTINGKSWLYLFYATQIGNKHNDKEYDYRYDRIKMMRQPLPK